MGTYLYDCPKCGTIEVFMKATEYKPVEKCPKCGSDVKRIYTPIAQLWKTDGAYKHLNTSKYEVK